MKARGWLFWTLSTLAVVVVVIGGLFIWVVMAVGPSETASAYDPRCGEDQACQVWRDFRIQRPFPYQTFAAARSKDGALVLVISEPAPVMSKAAFRALVTKIFGGDLIEYSERRWAVGVDGWLEDVVLKIKAPPGADPTADPLLRDRVAFLEDQEFGTSFGTFIERADESYADSARSQAAAIDATPAELRTWIYNSSLVWTPIDGSEASAPLGQLLTAEQAGTYIDAGRQLVLFVLPRLVLDKARANSLAMDSLRAPFRIFALSSDTILGGAWNRSGGLVLIARSRRTPTSAIPPLRFETFSILARETSGELQQSYERNNLFAGKLAAGPEEGHDWAPILLSKSLIDTEFGALLNTTDQFLKSWSEAGNINYKYFAYPLAPQEGHFVFGDKPLSDLVRKETGGLSVLFNWNTAGAAVTMRDGDLSVLAAGKTSALPVTYGSDLEKGQGMKTGNDLPQMRKHEEDAYTYFASLRDPNLARVVSYTLMYQVFRGAADDSDRSILEGTIPQRKQGADLLVTHANQFLSALDSNQIARPKGATAEYDKALADAVKTLRDYRQKYGTDNAHVAVLLADPRRAQAALVREAVANEPMVNAIEAREQAFDKRVDVYNDDVKKTDHEIKSWLRDNESSLPQVSSAEQARALLPANLRRELSANDAEQKVLDEEKSAIDQAERPLAQLKKDQDGLEAVDLVRIKLEPIVGLTQDLQAIRAEYMNVNRAEPKGRIKTPTVVLSWNDSNFESVGGHNLTARTVRIEVDPSATKIRLDSSSDGSSVLHVPPSQAQAVSAKAHDIARDVDFLKGDTQSIEALAAGGKTVQPRSEVAVLGRGDFDPAVARCAMTCGKPSSDATLKPNLEGVLRQNPATGTVMARDKDGYFVVAQRRGGRISCCTQFVTSADLYGYLGGAVRQGDIMVLGETSDYIATLVDGVARGEPGALERAMGGGGGMGRPPGGGGFDFFHEGAGPPPGPRPNGDARSPHGGGRGGGDGVRLSGTSGEPNRILLIAGKRRSYRSAAKTSVGPDDLKVLSVSEEVKAAIQWNEGRDGLAYIIQLRWPGDGFETDVVAGLDPQRRDSTRRVVDEAVALAQAAPNVETATQFQARVKSIIGKRLDGGGVKRLLTLIREGEIRFRLAHADTMEAPVE